MSNSNTAAVWAAACIALAALGAPATAAEDFCGQPSGEPAALGETIAKVVGFKKIYEGTDYLAYQDPANDTVYTFTRPGLGAAHPAAVCRKPLRDGDSIKLQMVVVCRGAVDACQRLESDFRLLNAQMEAHIRSQDPNSGVTKPN